MCVYTYNTTERNYYYTPPHVSRHLFVLAELVLRFLLFFVFSRVLI